MIKPIYASYLAENCCPMSQVTTQQLLAELEQNPILKQKLIDMLKTDFIATQQLVTIYNLENKELFQAIKLEEQNNEN